MAIVTARGPCPRIPRQMSSAGPIRPHSVPNPAHGAEQLAMFFFLAGKVAQRLRSERLCGRAVVGLVGDEWHDAPFHQIEGCHVAARADLIQLEFFGLT
jgi:hypothetical protein